jgi:hypothetical protein
VQKATKVWAIVRCILSYLLIYYYFNVDIWGVYWVMKIFHDLFCSFYSWEIASNASIGLCTYVYMYEGRAASGPAPRPSLIYCVFSFGLTFYQSRTSSELQDLTFFYNLTRYIAMKNIRERRWSYCKRFYIKIMKFFVEFSTDIALYYYEYYSSSYLLTHGAENFLRSRQLCSHSRTSQQFMELESSLPCSQEPSTCPYPEPCNPHCPSRSL